MILLLEVIDVNRLNDNLREVELWDDSKETKYLVYLQEESKTGLDVVINVRRCEFRKYGLIKKEYKLMPTSDEVEKIVFSIWEKGDFQVKHNQNVVPRLKY